MFLLIPGSAVLAACGGDDKRTASPTPRSYYLALGDSIAYGFQPAKANAGGQPSAFDTGYVDVFAARLRKLSPKINVVNYGCPQRRERQPLLFGE
jgi:lysophospholipase L1-like esterase